ncbi:MAG: hypothetical protein IPH35_26270 [Rhodoferax sp.]|nr:hypothetical protein [Rhodoferax sp.]
MNKMSMRQDWRMFSVSPPLLRNPGMAKRLPNFYAKYLPKWDFFAAFLKDGGTDLEKAIRLLNEQGTSLSASTISPIWLPIFSSTNMQRIRCLTPSSQPAAKCPRNSNRRSWHALHLRRSRTKARFMNLHRLVEWADKLLKHVPAKPG